MALRFRSDFGGGSLYPGQRPLVVSLDGVSVSAWAAADFWESAGPYVAASAAASVVFGPSAAIVRVRAVSPSSAITTTGAAAAVRVRRSSATAAVALALSAAVVRLRTAGASCSMLFGATCTAVVVSGGPSYVEADALCAVIVGAAASVRRLRLASASTLLSLASSASCARLRLASPTCAAAFGASALAGRIAPASALCAVVLGATVSARTDRVRLRITLPAQRGIAASAPAVAPTQATTAALARHTVTAAGLPV